MSSFRLNPLQRVGLLIAAALIAWFLWEQIAENGLSETSWLPPILAIVAIIFVAAHGFELRKSATALDPNSTAVGPTESQLPIVSKRWRLPLIIAAVAIPVVGFIVQSLTGEKAADEAVTTKLYESSADGTMDAAAAPMSDAGITARANDLSRRLGIPVDTIERNIREMEAREGHNAIPGNVASSTSSAVSTYRFDRASLQLPNDWHWLSRADASILGAKADALTEAQGLGAKGGTNIVLVAGNALDDAKRSIATVRLSVRPGKAASQIEMRQALREPQAGIGREIVAEAERTASAMRRLPTTSYYRVTGGAFRQNASVVCLWTAFEYDVGKGPTVSDTWVCPLSDRTLKLSTSYAKAHAARFATMNEHIWRSLEAR